MDVHTMDVHTMQSTPLRQLFIVTYLWERFKPTGDHGARGPGHEGDLCHYRQLFIGCFFACTLTFDGWEESDVLQKIIRACCRCRQRQQWGSHLWGGLSAAAVPRY